MPSRSGRTRRSDAAARGNRATTVPTATTVPVEDAADASLVRIIGRDIERVPLDAVQSHPRNPNVGSLDVIVSSMRTNGFYGALIVQRSTGFILAGNHRWRAARELGMATVPVIYVDVDDERATRILLADNRTSELSHRDPNALLALLDEMHATGDGLDGLGFDAADVEGLRTLVETPNLSTEMARAASANPVPTPGGVAQYGVFVTLADEDAQRALFDRLRAEGYTCRLIL